MSRSPLLVFPAPAGINRAITLTIRQRKRVPRASGDKPKVSVVIDLVGKCSPRQRG
ncbi:hypothetical protein JFM14_003114 [Salmonella enterica]|uniref:Uncharacterized protein n=1 Tax=Salmonella enterica subsp. enterica serovar Cubana str. 76814 TaxID=1192560 RepID=V7IFR0_SALET|nr:hypothetical protein [Salmonella enterica]ETA84738.1 hypothetical protein A628_05250 [Salmonella enterica subsp. enterica serovar Cubana str. 76814]PQB22158.1 hypothetical protein CWT02_0826 [Salmonella enterica subsp. enterica serovar Cubana]